MTEAHKRRIESIRSKLYDLTDELAAVQDSASAEVLTGVTTTLRKLTEATEAGR